MTEIRNWAMGTLGLTAVLVVSVLTSRARPFPRMSPARQRQLLLFSLVAWVVQAGHFTEELFTGFATAFPRALGLSPWSQSAFVLFNAVWLVVWLAALREAPRGRRIAEWPLWFLAFALVANGLAHPALALRAQGYFPGLWTSMFAGLAGLLLLRDLFRLTE